MSRPRIPLLPIDEAVAAAKDVGVSEFMAKPNRSETPSAAGSALG